MVLGGGTAGQRWVIPGGSEWKGTVAAPQVVSAPLEGFWVFQQDPGETTATGTGFSSQPLSTGVKFLQAQPPVIIFYS